MVGDGPHGSAPPLFAMLCMGALLAKASLRHALTSAAVPIGDGMLFCALLFCALLCGGAALPVAVIPIRRSRRAERLAAVTAAR